MTKENFLTYDKSKDVYCECCKQYKPVTSFTYRAIKTNIRSANRCRTCEWLYKNHNGLIPMIDGYSSSEIIEVISFIIEQKGEYVNDIACILNKTIKEIIVLLYELNLKNLHISVKSNCECCGKEVINPPNVYMKNKFIYCSTDCYWKDKTTKTPHKENSQFYNRIKTNCTNCKKEIEVIQSRYNQRNKLGDNHNFCSKECYWEYRSKYYINEKSGKYNYVYTEEQKDNARMRLLNNLKRDDRLDTKIQLKINDILDNNNISYEREKIFDYYSTDNYLTKQNLIIEVMGDYWHVNPNKYNNNNRYINEMQQKQLHRDKIKYSYIKNHYNIDILYLWETDINKNPKLCEKLIKLYINNDGILNNYHSFNWSIIDDQLCLNNEIIIPYQNMSINEYRHLIKKKVG